MRSIVPVAIKKAGKEDLLRNQEMKEKKNFEEIPESLAKLIQTKNNNYMNV